MEDDQKLFPETDTKALLLAEYQRIVRIELPAAARAGKWILRFDHCFARVILDALFNDCWYAHLDRRRGRSAESQLNIRQLTQAIAHARAMLALGDPEVCRLNERSLVWRGKHRRFAG